ncbi:TRAP transporter permease [Bacillaceae bacterium Marseille-Q3522]|nr:TRAP transporter permease [Bacillaceae bacterium Marseille-Q3522]
MSNQAPSPSKELKSDFDQDGVLNNKLRSLKGATAKIIAVIAVLMSVFHLYTALFGVFDSILQRSAHLSFALILTFAIYKPFKNGRDEKVISWYDWLCILLTIGSFSYFIIHAETISSRMSYIEALTAVEIAIGVIAGILLLEATRRVIGKSLVIIIFVCLVYGFCGHLLTGSLSHREFTLMWIIDHLFYTVTGIFSTPLGVSATFIFLFILFGKFLEVSGAGQFFIDLSVAAMGKYRGGPAKTAVIASSILGTISGSAVANTVTTGAFTIPLMKKTGYKPHFAAAIEAVSSTGGQIMPPIMGASAFIIASYLGVPYMDIAIAAIIPAILYYLCLFVQVDLRARRLGLVGLKKAELPNLANVFKKGFLFFIPLIVIIFMLVAGYSPMRAGLFSIVITIVVAALKNATRLSPVKILKALDLGAKAAIETAIACAASGFITGIIGLTGIGLKFSGLIIDLSGGVLILALVFTMITSIILGMGLPTVAAYIVQVPLTIPALINLGVSPLAAHMFVFYFAALSAITPPVALAAFAGAGLAGSDPMKTGFTAVRLGLAAFLVPFMFVYGETLLLQGDVLQIIIALISAVIGIFALACAVEGWLLKHAYWYERVTLFAGAVLMVIPGILTDLLGAFLCFIVFLLQKISFNKIAAEQSNRTNGEENI